jgi:thiopeptide-type bacteriocin biosynthesis protein
MNGSYLFDSRVILRTPRYPLNESIDPQRLLQLLQDKDFLEAIYLASPVLYDECVKWKEGQLHNPKDTLKLTRSLGKYILRMSSRPTPFGLFSGLGVTQWHEGASEVTLDRDGVRRHTRLDMHYLCALSQRLISLPCIRFKINFFVNNSIYKLSDELRYVESCFIEGKQLNQISSVNNSAALQKLLITASEGATVETLCRTLVEDGFETEDSLNFVEDLISAQVIVSELQPAITGEEYLEQIIGSLSRINVATASINVTPDPQITLILDTLLEAQALLLNIDQGCAEGIDPFRSCIQLLGKLEVPVEEGKFFQTDMFRSPGGKGISTGVRDQLQEALDVLNRLGSVRPNPNLQAFIQQFTGRYEDREMPLLEVLDTESGIGYVDSHGGGIVPLVEDILITTKEQKPAYSWTPLEDLLQQKLLEMYRGDSREIRLTEADVRHLGSDWESLPASFGVMFRLVREGRILLENAGGSSGVNLLGRFAHGDAGVRSWTEDIARQEQELDPGIIYAEIVHLPESRTGNILLHPAFRDYEIPYLAQASVDGDHRVDLRDLYVSVRRNRIVLRSRLLNKEIIPRLSSSHNYTRSSLPIYRFLCDLQLQGKRGSLTFHWGSLKGQHRFLPRVTFKQVILHPASWDFTLEDITHLKGEGENALRAFRKTWNLPRHVVLADSDNELLIDLEDEGMVNLWMETIKNRSGFTLKEFLHPDGLVTDTEGQPYVNQCIGVIRKTAPVYAAAALREIAGPDTPLRAQFLPGSEWVYYKLYTGIKTADKILLEFVKPLTDAFAARGWIDKWFFIRFNDPDFHIRLRFHLSDISHMGAVTAALHTTLEPLLDDRLVWKVQLDTYNREMDRYGTNTIELAEAFFHQSSLSVIAMLGRTNGDERETSRWLWALGEVNNLLRCFGFSEAEKLALVTRFRDGFDPEFPLDKALRQQLSNKYRKHRPEIDYIMEQSVRQQITPLLTIADDIRWMGLRGELQVPIPELIASYLHMMINRIVLAESRKQEMVIYDLLVRYYQSGMARAKEKETRGKEESVFSLNA